LEFNVPFQHKYGYIRDENQGQKIRFHNTRAVWTKWNGLVADNVGQAAGASILLLVRGVDSSLHSACGGPGGLLLSSATYI